MAPRRLPPMSRLSKGSIAYCECIESSCLVCSGLLRVKTVPQGRRATKSKRYSARKIENRRS